MFSKCPSLCPLSVCLQQMALVRGGQQTDKPVTPLRAPEPCPSPPVPPQSTSLSRHQPHSTPLARPFPHLQPFLLHQHTSTLLRVSLYIPLLPLLSSGLYLVGQLPPPPPPVVQAVWMEQMVREGQEETSSNLGAQPDLAHSECLMPA